MAIIDCPVPTIAAVNGAAAGAGANLALAADVVIATESAYFLQAFTRIGLIPDAGGTYWLPRQMGAAKAMGAALFADRIDARQADDWGMIWEAVADDVFEAPIGGRGRRIWPRPDRGLMARSSRRSAASLGQRSVRATGAGGQLQGECGKTRDFKEGVWPFWKSEH